LCCAAKTLSIELVVLAVAIVTVVEWVSIAFICSRSIAECCRSSRASVFGGASHLLVLFVTPLPIALLIVVRRRIIV
jgi:hypothetical protein